MRFFRFRRSKREAFPPKLSIAPRVLKRDVGVEEGNASHDILEQIEAGDTENSHGIIEKIKSGHIKDVQDFCSKPKREGRSLKNVLFKSSALMEHQLRTPLMAAAANGDFVLFLVVLQEIDGCFQSNDEEVSGILFTRAAMYCQDHRATP